MLLQELRQHILLSIVRNVIGAVSACRHQGPDSNQAAVLTTRGTFPKGLQLRLELGNVVTGEGERGESGSWRLDG